MTKGTTTMNEAPEAPPEAQDPPTIGDLIPASLVQRLREMGYDPDNPPEDNAPDYPGESPQEAQERRQRALEAVRARWVAKCPPMFAEAALADLDAAQEFTWPEESLNLVLAGPVGTGKTHAAYAIGNALLAAGTWVEVFTVVDLLEALRPDGNHYAGVQARHADVLLLDDLGATKASDWAVEQMTALLDHRIRHLKRTVVTTNVPEADLEAVWGPRFMDRLRFRRTVAVFRGESRRTAAW